MKFVVDAKSQSRERGASSHRSPPEIIGFYHSTQPSNASPSCGGAASLHGCPKQGLKVPNLADWGFPYLDEALEISRLGGLTGQDW